MTDNKIAQAEELIEELKALLLEMMWSDMRDGYNNQKLAIPWIHEDYRYAIKRLALTNKNEAFYLDKIERIIGEYAEFYT